MLGARSIDPSKVAVYIRWSTDGQDKGTTLAVQLEKARQYLQLRDWEFSEDRVYIDDGYSGASLDRPAMTLLRRDVRDGYIECVVVYKLDRLSRSIVDTVDLVLREWDGICVLHSTQETINTSGDHGRMFFNILAMFADFERSTIRTRTLSGKRKRAEQGRNAGYTPAYGYTSKDGTITIDEDKAAVVRRIFEECIAGRGSKTIAKHLNDDGIPAPGTGRKAGRTGRWNDGSIRRILANRSYLGELAYGKTRTNPRYKPGDRGVPSRLAGETPIVVEKAFEPIVTDEIFALAQQRMKERTATNIAPRSVVSNYLLSGIARCAKCGYMMAGNTSGRGNLVQYYVCNGHRQKMSECGARMIRRDELDGAVFAEVRKVYSLENRSELIEAAKRRYVEDASTAKAAITSIQAQLDRIAGNKERYYADYEAGTIDGKILSERLGKLSSDEVSLTKTLEETKHSLALAEGKIGHLADSGIDTMLHKIDEWEDLDIEQKKRLLRQFVASVSVYKGPGDDIPSLDIKIRAIIEA